MSGMATGTPGPVVETLRKYIPFDQMAPEYLALLAERLRLAFYAKNEVIARPEDGLAHTLRIIKQGRVQGFPPGTGAQEAVWDKGPGEVFGMDALMGRRSTQTLHVAVEDTFCFELGRDDFDLLMEHSSVFRDYMTGGTRAMEQSLRREMQSTSFTQVAGDLPLTAPLRSFIRRAPVTCRLDTPIFDAFQSMNAEHVGSVVVLDGAGRPQGILTLRDVLPRVIIPHRPLETPIAGVMSPHLITLGPDATAADAAILMAQRGVAHLCIVEDGQLTGVVSERDLFALQRVGMVHLTRAILAAPDVPALALAAESVHKLVDQMMAQGVAARPLVRIITTLNDHTAIRVIHLMLAQSAGGLPKFTWLAFGSEGRREQTLKTDQDNGIVFEAPAGASAEEARRALLPVASRINQALADVGFPLCIGNIMAGNPECCMSQSEWEGRFADWIDQGNPEQLLKANIFFDFRALTGDTAPAEALWDGITRRTTRNARFLHQLTANALQNRPPLGLMSDFQLASGGAHPHTLNLKLQGTSPFVDGARILALRHGLRETNTQDRLHAVAGLGAIPQDEAEMWSESFAFILLLRLRLNRRQAHEGLALGNHQDPNALNELDRRMLKEAFRQSRKLQSRLALDYAL
jgi:CBS domain-containing protein